MRTGWIAGLAGVGLVALAGSMTLMDAAVDAGTASLPPIWADFLDRLVSTATMFAAAVVVLRLSRLQERTEELEGAVTLAREEGRAWRKQSQRFVQGLSRAIEAQFDLWGLSAAEADVAGLMLKGASLREIAGLRRTSEATIRQQAQNVYRKSGLNSRAELAAYFLEDLFALSEAGFGPDAGHNLQ
jgi:DNA-binding CsgD family transcriptional regulator